MPSNEGSFRPIKVIAPLGSIFNPKAPASAEARFTQCNRMIDLIIRALAPVLPEAVIAGSSASISFAAYSGVRPSGDYWVFLEVNEGAYGGRPRSDGPDCIDNLMANTRNNPLEDLAMHIPMICDRYELRDDVPPGAGEFRGGIGVVKAQRVLTSGFITHESERHTEAPGASSAEPRERSESASSTTLPRPKPPARCIRSFPASLSRPTTSWHTTARTAAATASPLERPAQKVLEDVLDGFYTAEHAREVYGVAVDTEGETVDIEATNRLRSRMEAGA